MDKNNEINGTRSRALLKISDFNAKNYPISSENGIASVYNGTNGIVSDVSCYKVSSKDIIRLITKWLKLKLLVSEKTIG